MSFKVPLLAFVVNQRRDVAIDNGGYINLQMLEMGNLASEINTRGARNMKDDGFADAADRAWSFSASLVSGVNLSATLMTLLVAKGVLSKDDALWAIDEAAASSAKMNLPDVYANGIAGTFTQLRTQFDSAF